MIIQTKPGVTPPSLGAILGLQGLGASTPPLPPASVLPPGIDDNPENRYYYAQLATIAPAQACGPQDTGCIAQNFQLEQQRLQAQVAAQAASQQFYQSGQRWSPSGGPIDAATAYREGLLINQPTTYVPPVGQQPPGPQQPPPVVNQPGGPGPVIPAGTQFSPTASLKNITHPGAAFQVGDKLQVLITRGKPGAQVTASSSHNGGAAGTATMGTLDAAGEYATIATMTTSEVGSWTEQWFVDGQKVGDFSFQVRDSQPGTTSSNVFGDLFGSSSQESNAAGSGNNNAGGAGNGAGLFGISPKLLLIGGAGIIALLVLRK